jgi:serine/threonine protein phosphatase 1
MKTFVVPDLHGRYDLLFAALGKIRMSAEFGKVVFLGDYVDRGPASKAIIDRLIQGPPDGWTWVFLKGNHEDMLLQCHDDTGSDFHWWANNGGTTTLDSYGGKIDPDHLEWFAALPTYHADAHRVYVHAGLGENYDLADQPEAMTQWYRYPKGADVGYRGKHVVHGHTPQGPELFPNRTNLDAGAWKHGTLCVGVFDDDTPGGPIHIMRVGLTNV